LHRAVVAALLDGNSDGPKQKREGWAVATSDNALMHGHRLGPDGYIAGRYGATVQALVGGLQVGTDYSQIRPPSELHIPFMHPPIGHCCILGSCVRSAYMGGQPRSTAWGRSS
jgi:hypothetical protein